jgi:hypothetical protein
VHFINSLTCYINLIDVEWLGFLLTQETSMVIVNVLVIVLTILILSVPALIRPSLAEVSFGGLSLIINDVGN